MSSEDSFDEKTTETFIKLCQEEEYDLTDVDVFGLLKLATLCNAEETVQALTEHIKGEEFIIQNLQNMNRDGYDINEGIKTVGSTLIHRLADEKQRKQLNDCSLASSGGTASVLTGRINVLTKSATESEETINDLTKQLEIAKEENN